jgi:large subunit ribosomal protein L24e
MAELKNARTETETARATMSSAQAARKRKLDERRALVDAKRSKLLGGDEEVQRRKTVLREEAAEALLRELDETIQRDGL